MHPRFSTLAIALIIIALLACNRNMVKMTHTNASKEVPQLTNFVFKFDKPLVSDSLLGQWESTEYIKFEPSISGSFKWNHSDELVFSPSKPLNPATTYKAKLVNNTILRFSKYDNLKSEDVITFHTADLKLDDSHVTWIQPDENSQKAIPQADLYFNYPVDPTTLKNNLSISVDGKPVEYSIQTVSIDNKITLRLLNIRGEDKDIDVKMILNKGIVPEGGHNGLKEQVTTNATIPSPYVLLHSDIQPGHDGTQGRVLIKMSQQIVASSLKSAISIKPAIKFSAEVTDDGFVITSDAFKVDESYSITLRKGLQGKIGGQLRSDIDLDVVFGQLEPSISFINSKGVYLSSQGAKNIEIRIASIPKVKIIVSKIYESNLLVAQHYGYNPSESGRSNDDQYYEEESGGDVTLGDIIYEKEIDTKSLPLSGGNRLFTFNPEDRIANLKGIYHIKIRSANDYWLSESRFISLSDIGLIAKEGHDKIFVFANSIKTASSIKGVNVIAYGANNQILAKGSTNGDGAAELVYTRKEFAGFKPAMIIAKTENDFNYLPFSRTMVNTSRFEVGGKRINTTGLDAFIYAERDIYRPGERVNFAVAVRDAQWKTPENIPIKLKVLMPNGKELQSFRKNLNTQGVVEGNVNIAAAALTGSYTLEVYTGNDILIASKNFMIEEFVPDRIKVSATLDKLFLMPNESTTLNAVATNFFGPPAANRNYECDIQVKQQYFSPKNYSKYNFYLANQNSFFDKQLREGKTDENGKIAEPFSVPETFENVGLLNADFYTTVFDETGRPVSRKNSIDVYTQSAFFGIADDGYNYLPLNQQVKFPLIALNKNEQPTKATAKVEIIKHEYRTVLEKSDSYFRYNSQKEEKIIISGNVTVAGEQTHYSFVPRSPGEYEIRVSVPDAAAYVSKRFYSYGHWGGDNTSFEVNNEGQIDIATDKESYKAGDDVKLLFKTPFSGRMLVTVENEDVLSYHYLNVDKRTASMDLNVSNKHLPNVYVTATLIKPHTVSDIPLTVAHGFQRIRVEEPDRHMKVEIITASATRSRTRQKVKVKAAAGSAITLAAVDNGVLQVTDFETPDPYNFFYTNRALSVKAFDLYPLLFPEVKARLSSTGGDGDMSMDQRINPMPNKRVQILSYWSGVTTANSSGVAEFEFDIPQFSGEIRLMAVAIKDEKFGSAEATTKVADPLVLSTAMPRFLSPSDTITIPVTVSNTTKKNASLSASLSVTGPLQIIGNTRQTASANANSETRVLFRIAAASAIGVGKVKIDVQGLGEKFTEEINITVRPASTLQKVTAAGVIAANASQRISIATTDFMPQSLNYNLIISKSPALELATQLSYLVQYPHGCTEQVISVAFPQLYFSDMAELLQKNRSSKITANANIHEAIKKIKMRQLYSGAVTLWDNEGSENWWSTVYAAHFLLEARKAGYEIDKNLLDPMLNYINDHLRNKETITYYYNRDQQKKIAPKEVAYSLYVLALAGRKNVSVMNYYKANPSLLSLDSKYLLAVAYAIAGDKGRFREMLPASFNGEISVTQSGGSFYSEIRDEAIALNALLDADPTNNQVPVMAKHVVAKLKQRYWYSTQESVFGFLAIGKMAASASKSNVSADVKVNGKTIASLKDNTIKLTKNQLNTTDIEIATKGNGKLYYWWEAEGISTSGAYKEEDNFIKVRRRFFDRYGRPVTNNSFTQNDLIVVQLTLEKMYAGSIDNIIITDLIPAGFEIENPRTKEIPDISWIKDDAPPTAMDVRDDRINLFVDANNNKQVYYYAVRAVSSGVYHMGPVSADAMYNGEYHSYHGAGKIIVR